MGKRLIATGITDSNGQVKITYTGKGAGKLQLTAESGTLQSETYSLYDCIFLDRGTSTDYNNSWVGTTVTTRTRNATDTTLSITDSTSSSALTGINFYNNECIEFDGNASDASNIALSVRKGSSNYHQVPIGDLGCSANTYYHIKVTCVDGTLTFYVNGTSVRVRTISNDHEMFYIRLANGATLNYKNFMKYPI